MLYKPSKNLTLVVYEDQKPIRCYEVKKKHLKSIVTVLPIITVVCLLITVSMLVYFKTIKLYIEQTEDSTIQLLREEKKALAGEKSKLEVLNEQLYTRLSKKEVVYDSILPFVKPVSGAENLSAKGTIGIEDISYKVKEKESRLFFNMTNAKDLNDKIAGYAFVLMKSSDNLFFFPKSEIIFDNYMTTFNQGERFAFTKLRPIEAKFPVPKNIDSVVFRILIFSRTGDRMVDQIIKASDVIKK